MFSLLTNAKISSSSSKIFRCSSPRLQIQAKQSASIVRSAKLLVTERFAADAFTRSVRFSIKSPTFAATLFSLLQPHLPEFPYPPSHQKNKSGKAARPAHSLNSNIRFYKYLPGHRFGAHYDDNVVDPTTAAKSEWTLLVYLSGEEDGVRGGEVSCKTACFELAMIRYL